MMQINQPSVNQFITTANNLLMNIFNQTKLINTLGAKSSYSDQGKIFIKKTLMKSLVT